MSSGPLLLAVSAILLGMVGIVVPVLPGLTLAAVAAVGYAMWLGGAPGWVLGTGTVLAYAVALVLRYLVPQRRLRAVGVGSRTMLLAVLVGIVGFFVVPVVGMPLGFVATVYAIERVRVGAEHAWASTVATVRAVAVTIGVDLAAAVLMLTGVLVAGWWASSAI